MLQEAEKKRKVEKLKQKRWQEKHRRFIFGVIPNQDGADLEREPLLPSGRNDSFPPPPPQHMLSISEDSDFYKDKRGSLSLMQILEGLPDDKTSRDTTSRSRILSMTDVDSDSGDSVGSTGPADSYDLIKSREGSQDKLDSDKEEPVVSISVPPVRIMTPPRHTPPRDSPPRHSPPRYMPPRHSPPRHADSGSEDETLQATTRL